MGLQACGSFLGELFLGMRAELSSEGLAAHRHQLLGRTDFKMSVKYTLPNKQGLF